MKITKNLNRAEERGIAIRMKSHQTSMEKDQVVQTNLNKSESELSSTSFKQSISPESQVIGFHTFEEDKL